MFGVGMNENRIKSDFATELQSVRQERCKIVGPEFDERVLLSYRLNDSSQPIRRFEKNEIKLRGETLQIEGRR